MSSLKDLNAVLFNQLYALNDAKTDKQIETETKRAKAVCSIAQQIVSSTSLQLEAIKVISKGDYYSDQKGQLKQIVDGKQD